MPAPRVSIILPVFNGEETIQRALESIKAQVFTDFRVLMIDNASTDDTGSICRKFSDSDPRFEYYRNSKNRGVSFSFQRALYMGLVSEFMVYIGRDDHWHPMYLAKCVEALDKNPDAVLAYSYAQLLAPDGSIEGLYKDDWRATSPDPATRFLTIIGEMGLCTAHYGLIRSENWEANAWLMTVGSAAGDNVLLASLALEGQFIQIEEPLFYRTPPRYGGEDIAQRIHRMHAMEGKGSKLETKSKPRVALGGVGFGFTYFITAHIGVINSHSQLFDYAAQDELYRKTTQILLARYGKKMEEEVTLAVDLIGKGAIHQRDIAIQDVDIPLQGQYKNLDYTALVYYLLQFDVAYGYTRNLNIPRFHLTRALLLIMLGRTREALPLLDMELAENPTCREALDLKAKLSLAGKA